MITVKNIYKTFGVQTLFEDASLQFNIGDRYALVGPNGAGKSTLMKMLLGELDPDQGEISRKMGATVGYLPQENPPLSEKSVLEEALSHIDYADGKTEAKAKTILMGLGFREPDFTRKINTLSGGWAMRVAMARLLLEEPDLLMMDEPTNHLDLDSLLWFQEYLKNYRGAIFLISHDRHFIDEVTKVIISLEDHKLKPYYGNYQFYLEEKQLQRQRLESAYEAQKKEIADLEDFIARNRARMSTASRAQSAMKRLESIERITLPTESKAVKIRFPQPERTGLRVLSLKNVYKSYGNIQVYRGLNFELERGQKAAFVGHNGAGKSTLLKMLAEVETIDGGERLLGLNVKTGYFSQHRSEMLNSEKTVFEEAVGDLSGISEQFIRTVLGSFLFAGESIHKKVSVLSGGEKSRLALVKLLLDPPNVLLMDEPTTHLDLASVDALIEALLEFEGSLCVISHDIYFLNAIANHVVHVEHGKVTVYPGNYSYFERRQKQLRQESGEVAPTRMPAAAAPAPKKNKGMNPKELRRLRAQERESARQKNQPQAQQTEQSNADAKRIQEIMALLASPEIYNDYAKVRTLTEELHALQKK